MGAYEAAKGTDLDDFKKPVLSRLATDIPALSRAANRIIELSQQIGHASYEGAMGAFVGTLLGSSVLFSLQKDGLISLDECQRNLVDYGMDRGGLIYDGQNID